MDKTMQRAALRSLLALPLLAPAAAAQMTGQAVDAEWCYPSLATVLEAHTVVVSPQVELPASTIVNGNTFEIDLGDDWVEFRFNNGGPFSNPSFNGWRFRDASNALPPVLGFTLDSFSSGISGVTGIWTGFDADAFWVDLGGVVVGGPGEWIRLRATFGAASPVTPFCFGDLSDTPCPCGNTGASGEGCRNSTGAGARMTATGSAVATNDDLVLHGSQLPPNVPSLFFAGGTHLSPAALFGDGLRCAGGSLVRLEIVFADGLGVSTSSVGIASTLSALPGTSDILQLWYRDPSGPCGGQFNSTGALDVTWQ